MTRDSLVENMLQSFRELLVDVERESSDLKQKLRPPKLMASAVASTTISSSSDSSALATSGSLRPPSYKSALKPATKTTTTTSSTSTATTRPQPPQRTKRRISSTTMSSSTTAARGALIVLEGLDRVGKSTLATRLIEHLEKTRHSVQYCRFPDRTTPIGRLIDEFLRSGTKRVDEHAMHLLFSANRWELDRTIRRTINQGTTIIVDRYSYSGIAYSSAKRDLSIEWCRSTERGLAKPDLVIYLELPKEVQYKRAGFGEERFETQEFQELVRSQYEKLISLSTEKWLRVDVADKSPDEILAELILPVKRCLDSSANKELGSLEFQ